MSSQCLNIIIFICIYNFQGKVLFLNTLVALYKLLHVFGYADAKINCTCKSSYLECDNGVYKYYTKWTKCLHGDTKRHNDVFFDTYNENNPHFQCWIWNHLKFSITRRDHSHTCTLRPTDIKYVKQYTYTLPWFSHKYSDTCIYNVSVLY